MLVPAVVPSVFQSSEPLVVKYRVLFTTVSWAMGPLEKVKFVTFTVPAVLPSVFQSCQLALS